MSFPVVNVLKRVVTEILFSTVALRRRHFTPGISFYLSCVNYSAMSLLLFVRYLCVIIKLKHETLMWQKRLIYTITKPVFNIFREIK